MSSSYILLVSRLHHEGKRLRRFMCGWTSLCAALISISVDLSEISKTLKQNTRNKDANTRD